MALMVPAKYKKLLASGDPGNRSKVPTKYLSAKQQVQRKAAQTRKTEDATLYNPMALLSGESLRSSVKSQVDAELNPQIAAKSKEATDLGSQRDQLAEMLKGIYGQVAGATSSAVSGAIGASGRLAEGLKTNNAEFLGSIDKAQGAFGAQSAQDQAIRGTGLDAGTSQRLAAEFVGQKARAESAAIGAQSLATAQSQGAIGTTGTAAAVLPGQATRAIMDLASGFNTKIQDTLSEKSALEANRGPLTSKILSSMRDTEFQKGATAETLKLKGQAEANDVAIANQKDQTTRDKATADLKYKYDALNQKDTSEANKIIAAAKQGRLNRAQKERLAQLKLKNESNKKTGKGMSPEGVPWVPPVKQAEYTTKFSNIRRLADEDHKKGKSRKEVGDEIMADNPDLPEAVVSAVLDSIWLMGRLSPGTVKKLHKAGVRIKGLSGVQTTAEYRKKHPRTTSMLDKIG